MADNELARVVRDGFQKLCVDLTERIVSVGFHRTKSAYWARSHDATVDVVHIHREGSSYAANNASVSVRLHLAIRVLNDDFDAIHLNGPKTDDLIAQGPRLHLRFNARSFSQYDRCLDDATRYVLEHGLPWFSIFSNPSALITRDDSPLSDAARDRLRAALDLHVDEVAIARSRKLLGLR